MRPGAQRLEGQEMSEIERPHRQAVESLMGTGTQSPCERNAQVGARKRGFPLSPMPSRGSRLLTSRKARWTFLCYR